MTKADAFLYSTMRIQYMEILGEKCNNSVTNILIKDIFAFD